MNKLLLLIVLAILAGGAWFFWGQPGEIKIQGDAKDVSEWEKLMNESMLWRVLLQYHRDNKEKKPYYILNVEKAGAEVGFNSGYSASKYSLIITDNDKNVLYEAKPSVRSNIVWKTLGGELVQAAAKGIITKYIAKKQGVLNRVVNILKTSKDKAEISTCIQLILDSKINTEKISPVFFELALNGENGDIRLAALNAFKGSFMAQRGKCEDEIRSGIHKIIRDSDARVRSAAAGTMAEIADEKDIRELLKVFTSDNTREYAKMGASETLGKIGEPAKIVIPELFEYSQAADAKIKKQALSAIRGIGTKDPKIIKWARVVAENAENPPDLKSEAAKTYLVLTSPWQAQIRHYMLYKIAVKGRNINVHGASTVIGDTSRVSSVSFKPDGKLQEGKSEHNWNVDNMKLNAGNVAGNISGFDRISMAGESGEHHYEWILTPFQK